MGEAEMKELKSILRAVLIPEKDGLSPTQLPHVFKDIIGYDIPFKKMGFQSFEQFILSIPDVASVERRGGEVRIHGVADAATSHIKALVSKQRSKKVKKPVRRRRGGGPSTTKYLPRPTGPRPPGPYRKVHPGTPGQHVPRYGVPSFISPPQPMSLTPVTISIGNVASGTRTIRIGSSPMFNKAIAEANKDKVINRPQQGSPRFEVPPRFRKRMTGMSPPQQQQQSQPMATPVRRLPQAKPVKLTEGDEKYTVFLSKHLQEMNHPLQFDTTLMASGYVSSIRINTNVYGSEDIFSTAKEAEAAAAKNAVNMLNLKQKQQESQLQPLDWTDTGTYSPVINWADEMSRDESVGSSLPKEQLLKVKSRIKEIIQNKKNGLWGTRIPIEYKEKYNEDPPAELMDLVKLWKDVARVEPVTNTDRELVYPVIEDPNRVDRQNDTTNVTDRHKQKSSAVATIKQNSIDKSAVKSPPIPTVKDLYGLYVDTVDRQFSVLKTLEIPRDLPINCEEPATVYMTYLHNPGYFCVQREDSVIDNISESLQTHCKSVSCPPADELEKGRYCAAIFSGDDSWTRAEILQQKDNGKVEVLFVDYGNVESVKEQDVRWLSPDLAKHPYQAVNCSLCGIQPLQGETGWGEAASNLFVEQVQDQALVAIPQSVCDNVVDVLLYLKSDTNLSINEKLVQAGVAMETKLEDDSIHPVDLVLPDEKEWDVHVTYISSSTESVMLRLVGEEFSDQLDAYQSKLLEAFRNSSSESPIIEGMTYVAHDDGLYHRVRVISQDDKKVQCYFLDHGDTDELLHEQLHPIDPQINKLLPYQAIEVSLYGLEDESTNITALEKICDLALGKTCVAEVVEREDLPSVLLYDTSGDNDININETILRTIEAEGGGISTPKTESLSPSNSGRSTPQRVLSPVPGDVKLTSAIGDSKSFEKLDNNANALTRNVAPDAREQSGWTGPSVNTDIPATKSPPSQQLSPNLSQLSLNSDSSIISDVSMKSKSSEFLDTAQNVSRPILGRSSSGKDSSVQSVTNDNDDIPKPFQIPSVGEYLDVHINFVHDPSNFVCIPYEEMNNLEQLLLDMMEFYKTPVQTMSQSDIQLGNLYAGHKDDVWYRVKVSNFVGSDIMSVYLVDIGEYSVMMLSEIQPLVKQFRKLPLMAISATLGTVVPESGSWYEAAKYKFIELAREKDLIGLVQGHDENTGIVNLRLIDTTEDFTDICIDEVLVKLQYATFKDS